MAAALPVIADLTDPMLTMLAGVLGQAVVGQGRPQVQAAIEGVVARYNENLPLQQMDAAHLRDLCAGWQLPNNGNRAANAARLMQAANPPAQAQNQERIDNIVDFFRR